MNKKESPPEEELLSNLARSPDDVYIVHTRSGMVVSGAFVLMPAKEIGAYRSLVHFYDSLNPSDVRRIKLMPYLERLGEMWDVQ